MRVSMGEGPLLLSSAALLLGGAECGGEDGPVRPQAVRRGRRARSRQLPLRLLPRRAQHLRTLHFFEPSASGILQPFAR